MINRRTFASLSVIATISAFTPPVFAWGRIVYDPTNHIQNTIAAVKAAAQEINQLRQLAIDTKQSMTGFGLVQQLSNSPELASLAEGITAAQDLHNAITEGRRTVEGLQNLFGASSFGNWQDFARSIAMRKQAGEKSAVQLMNAANAADKQIQQAYKAHKDVMSKMAGISGVTEAAQATANAVGVLIQQNQAMLMTMSAQAKDMSQERQVETLKNEAMENEVKRLSDSARDAYNRDAQRLGLPTRSD